VNRKRRRLLIVTVAVVCVAAAVGTAFAVVAQDASDPLTRDQVYHEGMGLEEIAAAATGQPGEIAPACPDVATVDRLKEAGLAFGPCDPVPEAGAPVLIPKPGDEPLPTDDDVVCPAISGKVGVHVQLPCAPGAKIVDADIFEVGSQYCVKLTYIPEKDSPSRTETLCEGDEPSVGGEPVRGPPTAAQHSD
jgi:hypothetical protein